MRALAHHTIRIRTIPSRRPDSQLVAEYPTNRDSASMMLTYPTAIRVSVRPVASDVSREVVRRAVFVALELWLVVDFAAVVRDLEVSHASKPVAEDHESVQEDQSRAVRRIADTPV